MASTLSFSARWRLAGSIASVFALLPGVAEALKIRSTDKPVVGEFQRVFGPQSPSTVINPLFEPSAALFSGMGWPGHPTEWYRNLTLVSPLHFIGAAHFQPDFDWKIRFLGEDGILRDYAIESLDVVKTAKGEATDLFVGTLEDAVDLAQVRPVPIFSPANRSYVGREMLVFGKVAEGMSRVADGEWMLQDRPGFDTTRFLYFDYDPKGTNPKDIHYQGGDSGSPAFVMVGGQPSLIGVASSADEVAGHLRNSMSLVPAYATQIDGLMESDGYHLKRGIHPEGLSMDVASSPIGALTAGKPGAVSLRIDNDGTNDLHNVRIEVRGEHSPDQVTGSGWISTKLEDGSWSCRRAGLATGAESSVSVVWNSVPADASLNWVVRVDGLEAVAEALERSDGAEMEESDSESLD